MCLSSSVSQVLCSVADFLRTACATRSAAVCSGMAASSYQGPLLLPLIELLILEKHSV